ncbi:MAG: FAD binding domain-containing protein [Planctomycetes bacterium]|nr:FAD binding domain-containing protein [Planctomycetota bacterium]MCB9905435.1 FAD binding domain-containing protein [Planctomycetota bacterium]
MLRLPACEVANPRTVDQALALLAEHGDAAMLIAGGTDLVPNMKHRLFEPELLVSLAGVDELRGVRETPDGIEIGAMSTLAALARDEQLIANYPALAQAVSLVAGPQLRNMGTLGGNVMLDTRCQWYNQTYFWRKSLGFCLKKDGDTCHVVKGGSKCVAAASNDSVPALMTLGASLVLRCSTGERVVSVDDFWKADGIANKRVEPGELLVAVRLPRTAAGHRGAYGKLRDRGSIDFPLLGMAARVDLDASGKVADADLVVTALQARPVRIKQVAEILTGTEPGRANFDAAVEAACTQAAKQCKPMPNIPGDHDYRRAMVPVYARRTLRAAVDQAGPVHHI